MRSYRTVGNGRERARWERAPASDSLWLLPPGPDQVRGMASPAPIQHAQVINVPHGGRPRFRDAAPNHDAENGRGPPMQSKAPTLRCFRPASGPGGRRSRPSQNSCRHPRKQSSSIPHARAESARKRTVSLGKRTDRSAPTKLLHIGSTRPPFAVGLTGAHTDRGTHGQEEHQERSTQAGASAPR